MSTAAEDLAAATRAPETFTLTRLDLLVVGLCGALVALGTLAVLVVGAIVVEGMVGR